MKPRKWTVDEKLEIVPEGLKEKKSVAEICREQKTQSDPLLSVAR